MFGWLSAKCPVQTYEKTWTEWRMRWLADHFGIDRLLRAQVILPTDEFFPEEFNATEDDARRMLNRLCGYLNITPNNIRFEVCPDVQMPGALGHYDNTGQTTIRIVESQLADPQSLVATLTHELAHELLLGGKLLSPDAADHEWVTDLLPVFLGAGIFAANATVQDRSQTTGTWHSWRIRRQGYLPAHIFGYALALFALMRHEENPTWATHLRLDAFAALKAGLRYLRETDDSLFHPDSIRKKRVHFSAGELANRLRTCSASVRLSTLWEISQERVTNQLVVAAVTACLADRDPAISAAAGGTLAALGPAAATALPQLVAALSARHENTRGGAARALGALGQKPEIVVPELAPLVNEPDDAVAIEAAVALRRFGRQAEPAASQVLASLTSALIDCRYSTSTALAGTLAAISSDPVGLVQEYFAERDPELCDRALAALEETTSKCEHAAIDPELHLTVKKGQIRQFVVVANSLER